MGYVVHGYFMIHTCYIVAALKCPQKVAKVLWKQPREKCAHSVFIENLSCVSSRSIKL